jgi:hypothetical protein
MIYYKTPVKSTKSLSPEAVQQKSNYNNCRKPDESDKNAKLHHGTPWQVSSIPTKIDNTRESGLLFPAEITTKEKSEEETDSTFEISSFEKVEPRKKECFCHCPLRLNNFVHSFMLPLREAKSYRYFRFSHENWLKSRYGFLSHLLKSGFEGKIEDISDFLAFS